MATVALCECADPGCEIHEGRSQCEREAFLTLYRVDMDDKTGTMMCDGCAGDALATGLFREGGR